MSNTRTDSTAIATRYATAIFSLATEAKNEAIIVDELAQIAGLTTTHAELHEALHSPLISRADKAAVLADIAKKAGTLTQQSLAIIAEGGRADLLPEVVEILKQKLAETHGEIIAEITSARPLSESVQQQLIQSLARATGKKVQLELKQDPAVLGGVAIQFGSLRLDATLAGALTTMRASLIAHANQSI